MEKHIEFTSNHKKLKGTLRLPDDQAGRVPFVILLHGFCDERNELNFVHRELAERLEDAGIGSLRFDFNGSGESEGRFEDMTISSEVEDAIQALDLVLASDYADPKRIALHGLSLGGCVASITAGRRKEDVAALSLWCPAPDVAYNLHHKTLCGIDVSDVEEKGYMDVEGLRAGLDFYYDALQLDPFKEAAAFDKEVNLVHGDADVTASCECSKKYKEIFGDRARLLIVPGADHRFTTCDYRKARMDSAVNFLKEQLLDDSGKTLHQE